MFNLNLPMCVVLHADRLEGPSGCCCSFKYSLCSPRFYAIMLICRARLAPIHYRLELRDCFLYFPSLWPLSGFFSCRAALSHTKGLAERPTESAACRIKTFCKKRLCVFSTLSVSTLRIKHTHRSVSNVKQTIVSGLHVGEITW